MKKVVKEEFKPVITKGSINVSEEGDKRVAILNKPQTKLAQSIIAKAKRYKELDAQVKLMKKEMDEIKDFFMAEMKDKQLDQLFADVYKICYSRSESLTFNAKEFQEKYATLYESYKTKYTETEKILINLGK